MRLKVIGDEKKECTLVIPADKVIKGDVDLSDMGLTKLPDLSAVTVKGNFDCSYNRLTSLVGAPKSVGGDFDCYDNQLTTLDGAPRSVGGDFYCSGNYLSDLMGVPQKIGGDFICDKKRLRQEYEEKKTCVFCSQTRTKAEIVFDTICKNANFGVFIIRCFVYLYL